MKDAVGGIVNIWIIAIFIVLISGYLAFSVQYNKAFRMKNEIIEAIEQCDGYENGTRTPSLETFCILADIFETTTDYLLGREVPIVTEDGSEYIGAISRDDIDIINEIRHYPNLYKKLIKDVKRYVSLIVKKMR